LQSGKRRYRFTDRGGLEKRFGRHGLVCRNVRESIAAGPDDLTVIEDSNTDTWYAVMLHSVREAHSWERLSLNDGGWQQAILYPTNPDITVFGVEMMTT